LQSCTDPKNIQNKYENYLKYIESQFENDQSVLVQQKIGEIFQEYYNERLNHIRALSKQSNLKQKKAFFYKIKEVILRSRLMQHRSPFAQKSALEQEQEQQMLRNSLRPLFFPESNRDNMPESENSALYKTLGID
jgi:hypothetical protein